MDIKAIILAGAKANCATLEYNGLKITYKGHSEALVAYPTVSSSYQFTPASEATESAEKPSKSQMSFDDDLALTDPLAFEEQILKSE